MHKTLEGAPQLIITNTNWKYMTMRVGESTAVSAKAKRQTQRQSSLYIIGAFY